ncbi:hypothetical protein HDG37_006409 [Paraburkholderia sp. MM5384-R2]|nr:hypothetical protein [Paraburkholderia sp. MM5384-R2]
MGRSAKQVYRLTGREAMYSPGAPSLGHVMERRFWQQIATGITSEKAAEAVGVSQAVGSRWFRYRGGMPLFMSKPIAGRYLSFAEREDIALLSGQGHRAAHLEIHSPLDFFVFRYADSMRHQSPE